LNLTLILRCYLVNHTMILIRYQFLSVSIPDTIRTLTALPIVRQIFILLSHSVLRKSNGEIPKFWFQLHFSIGHVSLIESVIKFHLSELHSHRIVFNHRLSFCSNLQLINRLYCVSCDRCCIFALYLTYCLFILQFRWIRYGKDYDYSSKWEAYFNEHSSDFFSINSLRTCIQREREREIESKREPLHFLLLLLLLMLFSIPFSFPFFSFHLSSRHSFHHSFHLSFFLEHFVLSGQKIRMPQRHQ